MICKKCGKEFEGKFCPECGTPAEIKQSNQFQPPKPDKSYMAMGCLLTIAGIIVVLFLIGIASVLLSPDSSSSANTSSISQIESTSQQLNNSQSGQNSQASQGGQAGQTQPSQPNQNNTNTVQPEQPQQEMQPSQSPEEPAQSSETTGQKNAREHAINYIAIMPFSRDGLVEQLIYEGYSQADAEYGADHCGADWMEQAALKAKSYLETMPFSRQGLIDQLLYEKFTPEQAEYGVQQNGY